MHKTCTRSNQTIDKYLGTYNKSIDKLQNGNNISRTVTESHYTEFCVYFVE